MQHLAAAVPGLLEPQIIEEELQRSRALIEGLEAQSLNVTTAEQAREVRRQGVSLYERMTRLARAGYAPLALMPVGSFLPEAFERLGYEVSDLMRRLRRVVEHCQQVESLVNLRNQADLEREHRRRFPEEIAMLERHRELFTALYPDRWLLLYDGALRAEYGTAQEAVQAGEAARGRDEYGRPRFLVFCHRQPNFLSS